MDPKEAAARKAVLLVRDGMRIGLGTGTTAMHLINALGERVRGEALRLSCVPTSERSRELAVEAGLIVVSLEDVFAIDLAIDGADEVDPRLCLIKGGGGALVREKLVAAVSREFVVVCHSVKLVERLGAFPLPVAVIPFGWRQTMQHIARYGYESTLRLAEKSASTPYLTDDSMYILDLRCGEIEDPARLEAQLKSIPGVVEVGLFVDMASRVIIGHADGTTEERTPI
jgi:ribose 5-phosphate isomerase A